MWRELAWSDESEAHIGKHNVTPLEVEGVVNTRPQWEQPGVDDSTLVYAATSRELTDTEMRTFRREGR